MSEIKVNSIKGVAASSAAITVNNTDGTCTANITNNLSNRNLIINGAMQVAQRGTSTTDQGYLIDRFDTIYSGTDEAPTIAQVDVASGTTPYTLGFRKALKITNGNQTSGAGGGDYINIRTILEAQDVVQSGWNYLSSSSNITLSYWVKSSVAQNFYGYIRTMDGTNRTIAMETGALSADTWTKVTKVIQGDSNITIDNDNGAGLQINFAPFWGTDRSDNTVSLTSWRNYGTGYRTKDATTTWYTTNDATFEITGVQLEVGSVATDFEHRSFGQELFLCRRYAVVWKSKNENKDYIMPAKVEDADDANWAYETSPQMRSTPTIVISDTSHISMEYRNGNMANPVNFATRTYNDQYENRLFINMDINQNVFSEGDIVYLAFANYTANGTGQFILDAEL